MGIILSQSGISLADVYDIEGSIAGVDRLLTEEVQLVHEMGSTILSERLQSFLLRISSGANQQNTTWSVSSGEMPDCVNRILGVSVFIPIANATDISFCSVSIQNGRIDREIPFYTFSLPVDDEVVVLWNDDGAGNASFMQLRSQVTHTPQLITRLGLGEAMPVIRFNGNTTAFGAGTVTAIAIVHVCRPNPETPAAGQPSSHGLPLPGW